MTSLWKRSQTSVGEVEVVKIGAHGNCSVEGFGKGRDRVGCTKVDITGSRHHVENIMKTRGDT